MSLLDSNATALSAPARKAGEACARRLFQARGNHSEAHLSEYELALACAAAAEVALQMVAQADLPGHERPRDWFEDAARRGFSDVNA